MSVHYAQRHLAPMTPVQPPYHGAPNESAIIVDHTSYDYESGQLSYPSSSCHRSYIEPPTTYPRLYEPASLAKDPAFDYPTIVDLSAHVSPPPMFPPIMQSQPTAPRQLASPLAVQTPLPVVLTDMKMAKPGTVSAAPGFLTPIANYAAQLASWLWFAPPSTPFSTSPSTSPMSTSTMSMADQDTATAHRSINPLQVQVPDAFKSFVERLLRITSVSHSVVLISLLYLSRLTQKQEFCGPQGTENGAFVVSLMLANKYLDDNTYTNRTWADLSDIAITKINRMESHFLSGLDYSLRVEEADFVAWSKFLDGFMLSHQRQNQRQLAMTPNVQPLSNSSTIPHSISFREAPRARSHSPRDSFNEPMSSTYISPTQGRKRSAGDAFQIDDSANMEQVAKSMRIPQRRGYVHLPGAIQQNQRASGSQLGRAISLTRGGRPTSHGERRGSTPGFTHVYNQNQMSEPTAHVHQASQGRAVSSHVPSGPLGEVTPNSAFHSEVPVHGHPEQLVFYTLAAEAHPGQDGSRRKATLHYQVPQAQYNQQGQPMPGQQYPVMQHYAGVPQQYDGSHYSAQPLGPSYAPDAAAQPQMFASGSASATPAGASNGHDYLSSALPTADPYGYPQHRFAFGQPAIPAPAQFANAGPPAYQYQPNGYDAQQWPHVPQQYQFAPSYPQVPHNGMVHPAGFNSDPSGQYAPRPSHHPQHARAVMQSRSEWSSPMPTYGFF